MTIDEPPVSFVAAFYADEEKAAEVLSGLERMEKDGAIHVLDAAVMSKSDDGVCTSIRERAELTKKKGAIRGAAAGGLLTIIFRPSILVMGAVGAATRAAIGHVTDQGFDNNQQQGIGENLPAGEPFLSQ